MKHISGVSSWATRGALFALFLVCGVAIFVFGSGYFTVFPTNNNPPYLAGLAAVFLVAAVLLQRNERLKRYWRVAYAFFTASAALLFSTLVARFAGDVLGWFGVTTSTSAGIAIAKSYEMVMVVLPILVLTKLSGADLGSLYLRRGDLRTGLFIGVLVVLNFGTSALLFFGARYSSTDLLVAAVLWGVLFSLANGFMEELWMRSIFLGPMQPLLGATATVLVTSIVFALTHVGVVYVTPAAVPFLMAYALTLGIACGTLTIKTGSLWAATLVHLAADLFAFIAILANA